jgi:hypothetical protein
MSIAVKGIKDGSNNYTGLGEFTAGETLDLTGPIKFADGTSQTTAFVPGAGGSVNSVFTRTGDVVAQNGDYTAGQITNVATGRANRLVATTVQGALDELDTEKLDASAAATLYQPLDGDLTAIAGIADTAGLLRKTAADTWALDATQYLTAAGAVTSFNTRVGAVVPAAGDYAANLVTLDPTNVAGVTSTNVQGGMEELATLIASATNGLVFMGLIGFNDADPADPDPAGPSHYFIFNTEGARTVGDAAGANVLVGDWLIYHKPSSAWVHFDYSARTATAASTTYDPTGNTYITATNVDAAIDQADAALVSVDTRLDALEAAPGGVESFKGRTGAVLPTAGDYNAQQTTFAPVGAITATNVQDAIAYVEANTLSQGDLDAHINQATNAHAATAIGFAPAGGIVATNVQAAIEEVKATVRLGSMPFYDTSGALKPIANI